MLHRCHPFPGSPQGRIGQERACVSLGVPPESIGSLEKNRHASAVHYLVGGLAIERWRIRAGDLGAVLGRRPDAITRWAARAGELRLRDDSFRARYEALDAALAGGGKRRR